MFKRLWVWIPAPYTGWAWHFFSLNCCKNCIVCLKRTKINEKEVGVGNLKKWWYHRGYLPSKGVMCIFHLQGWSRSGLTLSKARRLRSRSSTKRSCRSPCWRRSRGRSRSWSSSSLRTCSASMTSTKIKNTCKSNNNNNIELNLTLNDKGWAEIRCDIFQIMQDEDSKNKRTYREPYARTG